jgi:hypothetical protein
VEAEGMKDKKEGGKNFLVVIKVSIRVKEEVQCNSPK